MSNAPGTVFIVSQYCSVNQLIPCASLLLSLLFVIPHILGSQRETRCWLHCCLNYTDSFFEWYVLTTSPSLFCFWACISYPIQRWSMFAYESIGLNSDRHVSAMQLPWLSVRLCLVYVACLLFCGFQAVTICSNSCLSQLTQCWYHLLHYNFSQTARRDWRRRGCAIE